MNTRLRAAPELIVQRWLNTDTPLTLARLQGRVVVIEAFQMLCPGCVSHGLPQAARVHATFPRDRVAVIGLHTVFEHHAGMTAASLEPFLHEYRISFPVGIDTPADDGPIPKTMQAYAMRGTPTLILVDAQGRQRFHHFGQVDDLMLGARIATLIAEADAEADTETDPAEPLLASTESKGASCALDGRCD